jgi:hypothetical protein
MAVLLPDGSILLLGGTSQDSRFDVDSDQQYDDAIPVNTPEKFRPNANPGQTPASEWRSLAPHWTNRLDHSSAVLLPDGRVFVIGGEDAYGITKVKSTYLKHPRPEDTVEIFSPDYLFRGARFTWAQIPPRTMPYGQTYTFQVGCNENLVSPDTRVVLMRPGTATHSYDFDQRYVQLTPESVTVAGTDTYQITVKAPLQAHAGACPSGWYMLFVVSANGNPCRAQFVKVQ